MEATFSVENGLCGTRFAILSWIISRREAISIGFIRTSSACERMTDNASSSSGYPLSTL